jgi:hypothetical protein
MDELEQNPDEIEAIERRLHGQAAAFRRQHHPAPEREAAAVEEEDDEDDDDDAAVAPDLQLPAPDPPVPAPIVGAIAPLAVFDTECMAPDVADMYAELGEPQPQSECFACNRGRRDSAAIAYESYRKMENMFDTGLSVKRTITLCTQLEDYFERFVRKPANRCMRDGEDPIPEWRAATIYMHIKVHMVDTGVNRDSFLRMYIEGIHAQYAYRCWQYATVEGRRVRVPRDKGWLVLDKMVARAKSLTVQNMKNAAFSWTGIGTPREESRPMIQLSKKRMYSQNSARFAGTSIAARAASAGSGSTVQGGAGASKKRRD